jgi:hypothetical protein
MRFQPLIRPISLGPAAAAAAAVVLAGCGSSGSSNSGSSSSPSPSATTGGSTSAVSAIKANWEAFFSASTPTAKRVALLQNGQLFQALIAAQSKSSIASSASAKVNSVSKVTATQATVNYTIIVAGAPALTNQKGVAVYDGGTWKVGDASFCGLLGLEKTSGLIKIPALPAACASAG